MVACDVLTTKYLIIKDVLSLYYFYQYMYVIINRLKQVQNPFDETFLSKQSGGPTVFVLLAGVQKKQQHSLTGRVCAFYFPL